MIRIIYAVPENHELVERIIRSKANKDVMFNHVDKVNIQELTDSDFENNIIIARGISYLILTKKIKYARIIELAVTGYDIMRGIEECKEIYKARNIAVILPESIVIEKEFIEKTLNVNLSVYAVRDHAHVADVFNTVKRNSIDAILGGLTVYRLAERDNFNCVRISVGHEAHKMAITEAFSVANAIIEERKKNELFRIILENTNDGILSVDNMGVITAYNKAVQKILNIPSDAKILGENISSVSPGLDEIQFSLYEYQQANVLKNINQKMVVINTKPIRLDKKVLGTVLLIQNVDRLQKTEIDIRQKLSKKGLVAKYDFTDIIGQSESIRKAIMIAQKYADTHSNVLIIGETGTGKELFAQSIHKRSQRRDQPFLAINCAALPEHLLESELFGYVEGAFTGASKGGKVGLFELAHRGTLFLDEIAELPLGLQAKLLRVLQENEIRKLGDDKIIPVDVRIVAASNVDLQQKVEERKFRQDLLYRLDILRLNVPPLRNHKNDIKDLTCFFLEEYAKKLNTSLKMDDEAIMELLKYDWPGNIRELRNICERLTVLCMNNKISGTDVKDIFETLSQSVLSDPVAQEYMEKKLTRKEMAEMLGISRTTLWRKTKEKKLGNCGK